MPIPTLRQDYVIASYPGFADPMKPDEINGRPSYFNVIAVEEGKPADPIGLVQRVEAVVQGQEGVAGCRRAAAVCWVMHLCCCGCDFDVT